MAERLYDVPQAANLLGATPADVWHWIERGWLPAERLPEGSTRISESGLVRFLKDRGIDLAEIVAQTMLKEAPPADPPAAPAEPAAPSGPADPAAPAAARTAGGNGQGAAAPAETPGRTDTAAQVIEAILDDAVRRSAEAVHLEPLADGLTLSLRIDGVLHAKPNFRDRMPQGIGPRLVERLKVLAHLDVSESHRPQSGAFAGAAGGRDVEFRVATFPTIHGEKAVVRVVDRASLLPALDALGFAAADLAAVERALAQESGLVLLLGPARNDRRATLRALIGAAASPGRNVLAFQDVPFPDLAGLTQVVPPPRGRRATADAFSTWPDYDADVVLIEEIRDRASALDAVDAATKCLVVAGLPARGERPDPTILLAAGADPMALATGLIVCIVQRSARRICPHCKTPANPDPALLRQFGLDGRPAQSTAWTGKGCSRCSRTGHAGRIGLFSVLQANETLAWNLMAKPDGPLPADVLRAARYTPLREAAMEKVREGILSLEEAARVLGRP